MANLPMKTRKSTLIVSNRTKSERRAPPRLVGRYSNLFAYSAVPRRVRGRRSASASRFKKSVLQRSGDGPSPEHTYHLSPGTSCPRSIPNCSPISVCSVTLWQKIGQNQIRLPTSSSVEKQQVKPSQTFRGLMPLVASWASLWILPTSVCSVPLWQNQSESNTIQVNQS